MYNLRSSKTERKASLRPKPPPPNKPSTRSKAPSKSKSKSKPPSPPNSKAPLPPKPSSPPKSKAPLPPKPSSPPKSKVPLRPKPPSPPKSKAPLSPKPSSLVKTPSQLKASPPTKATPPPPPPPPPPNLVSLIVSHIEGLKSLKPILKPLYSLICSSFSYEVCQGNRGNDIVRNGSNLMLEDTITLSVILFEELHKRLLYNSKDASFGIVKLHKFDVEESGEELLLLLRCCVLLVRLHPYDQALTKQFQVIVALLRKLSFQNVPPGKDSESFRLITLGHLSRSAFRGCTKSSSRDMNAIYPDFDAKSLELYLSFVQQMQEVYLDELFADRPFLKCIAISDPVSSTCQNVPVHCSLQIESVLEVIAAHFFLSISGKDALQTLMESLCWTEQHFCPSPKVSFLVVSSLVNHPVMKSAPTIIFSHVISLLSEVISIRDSPEKVGPRTQEYLSAFHDSVILYNDLLTKLMPDSCSPRKIVRKSFDFYFQSEIYNRIDSVLLDLDNAWRAQSCRMFDKKKASMAMDAISYVKMNICIVNESYRNEAFSFLRSLITILGSVEINKVQLQSFKEMPLHDFCLFASILKLMSCSLLQATHCDRLSCLIALLKRNAYPMTFFAQYNFNVSIQVRRFLKDALKPYHATCKEFESMFVHFAGLLSLCIGSGLRILMNGCLFFMLVLVNALALELGSLKFLGLSAKSGTDLPASLFSPATVTSFATTTGSDSGSFGRSQKSRKVASNFQKERRMLFRDQTAFEDPEISGLETCNGERYLKCLVNNEMDIDDLADFIECKPWRDYNTRLSSIEKIRQRRIPRTNRRLKQAKVKLRSSERIQSIRKLSF